MTDIDARTVNIAADEARSFFADADKFFDQADRRHSDMVAVHREGWTQVARALDGGLRAIATAIAGRR